MDPRLYDLRRQLDRARQRVDFCRRGLERFNREADDNNPRTDRIRSKLEADLRLAEIDAGYAEISLADATAPTEVP